MATRNLLRASRKHLRAFVSAIEASGVVYKPVLMAGVDAQLGDLDTLYPDVTRSD